MLRRACLVLAGAALAGCPASSTPEDGPGSVDATSDQRICPAGLTTVGNVCVPKFDSCPLEQLALPGGGCRRVGVTKQDNGLRGPDGTLVALGPTCAKGFSADPEGGCDPVLPAAGTVCPAGTMRVLGQTTCLPVGDCNKGPYGPLQPGAQAIYVDAGYGGAGSDGSQAKPFTTIAAAVAAAKTSGAEVVAVAAGSYSEDLVLTSNLTIQGRCPGMVSLAGLKNGLYDATIMVTGLTSTTVTLRGLTVTGPARGVSITGQVTLTIEDTVLEKTGAEAVYAVATPGGAPDLTLRRTRVVKPGKAGIELAEADLRLEASEIQGAGAAGLQVTSTGSPTKSKLDLVDTLIDASLDAGIHASNAEVTVSRTAIQDSGAHGIYLDPSWSDPLKTSTLTLVDSVLARNTTAAARLDHSSTTLDGVTAKDTKAGPAGELDSLGLAATDGEVTITRSHLAGHRSAAIALQGGRGTIERSVIRDTSGAGASGCLGVGVSAGAESGQPSDLAIRESLVESNRYFGIQVRDSSALVERTLVLDTRPASCDGTFGVGIGAFRTTKATPSGLSLVVRDSTVRGSQWGGLYSSGIDATVERSLIAQTRATEGTQGEIGAVVATAGDFRATPLKLVLDETVLADNRQSGLAATRSDVAVRRCTIRKSRALTGGTEPYSAGLTVFDTSAVTPPPVPTSLIVEDSLVEDSETSGVVVLGPVNASVLRTTVRKTTTSCDEDSGWGLLVMSLPEGAAAPANVKLDRCLVDSGHGAGVRVIDAKVQLQGCAVVSIDAPFGDGLSVERVDRAAELAVSSCWVESAARAGLIYFGASGKVEKTTIRSSTFAIDLENGASPIIGTDNVYLDNSRNGVSFGQGLQAAPLPGLPDLEV